MPMRNSREGVGGGGGEEGCCPFQARYEKRGGGGGGCPLHARYEKRRGERELSASGPIRKVGGGGGGRQLVPEGGISYEWGGGGGGGRRPQAYPASGAETNSNDACYVVHERRLRAKEQYYLHKIK